MGFKTFPQEKNTRVRIPPTEPTYREITMNKVAIFGSIAALVILTPVACSIINTTASVTTAPGRVVQETFKTDNILSTYEGFFNQKASYDSRVAQIKSQSEILAAETDAAELRRLRMELSAMKQSCRELANQYNADASKNNDSLFQDNDLPSTLDVQPCEGAVN